MKTEVLVLGGGPGGYSAAFRAADLGKKVTLVERYSVLGGVCLNVGCIPSKTLLHAASVINEAKEISEYGISFDAPKIDLKKLKATKDKVSKQLTTGLAGLAKQRNVTIVQGLGTFSSSNTLTVQGAAVTEIEFEQAIIAVGSQAVKIPSFPNEDSRLMDSTDALALDDVPEKLLIIGGGIIGLEMATVYDVLGSQISLVEMQNQIIPGCDKDLIRPLMQKIKKSYQKILLSTAVESIEALDEGLKVSFSGDKHEAEIFDKVLVSVGRRPNGHLISADKAGIDVDERGFIKVDLQQRTNVSHIYAIGDVVGNPMLAHKAVHEGKIAAEVIAGHKSQWQALTIPSVAYTDPEIAWMGLTENEAKAQGIDYDKGAFPWAASGRALSMGRKEGLTKILSDKETGRILGAGMTGVNAGELLAEAVLALEMGACVDDIALTIHAHPTLSETFAFAAEMIEGSITDLMPPKKR
ncbi:MAG: dihydrolipoyl dehydrogenase [Methylococcales bacterium]|nr:dihydrolipoyl dehydrogenase [Methylococcales bacterium]